MSTSAASPSSLEEQTAAGPSHPAKRIGEHIGYGVRPSRRREGHATEMLRLTLFEARKRRIERVLLTCDRENEPSVKTILNNGGQFDSEEYVDVHGGVIARYWISL